VRDPLLNETLKRLAAEAATRLTTLVASGDQLPFDVASQDGPDSPFHSYVPLTSRYVEEREDEIRSLASFGPAREAVESADVAALYLEQRGEKVPPDRRRRSERMLIVFLAALWDGCTEFSLDRDRLDGALAVLDAEVGDIHEADVLVAPIVGLQMTVARLDLPHGMRVARADTFESPIEAMQSEGMGRKAWQPQFLAIAEQGEGAESGAEALRQLHELVSVMRLFRSGGVGLGPFAFVPTGQDRWRRVATGAPAARPGGYRLSTEEAEQLVDFAAELEVRPNPGDALSWAVRRFELGCGRETPLEGLSDHLLAMRAVLEGRGPVGASLPMRAAALAESGSGGRLEARERFEAALELERSLMRGTVPEGAERLASWIEDRVRAMLREAALGELQDDLGTAADESLIANGLSEGDAEIAVTAYVPEPASVPEPAPPGPTLSFEEEEEEPMDHDTRIMEPIPAEDEIRITATNWLEEVDSGPEPGTIEWPAGVRASEPHEPIDTPTVRHLFPEPEEADWEVGELDYDHYGRRQAG